MTPKKVALWFSLFLVFILAIDFINRLTVGSVSEVQQGESAFQSVDTAILNNVMLDETAVKKLLNWSDIKPLTPAPVTPEPAVVVATPKPKPQDQRKVVAAAIIGDPSQHLLGDDLLALKGVFYDGKDFASVEIQNINSRVTRYITFTNGKGIDNATGGLINDYELTEIGKYHVVLNKQTVEVKLQLFK